MNKTPMKASDPNDLERRILDPNIAKSEAEWWAKSRIEEFDDWWEDFVAEHDDWKYADSKALRRAAFQAGAASRDAEVEQLREQVKLLRDYMHRLACLGNGSRFGNSVGNELAKEALAATEEKQ